MGVVPEPPLTPLTPLSIRPPLNRACPHTYLCTHAFLVECPVHIVQLVIRGRTMRLPAAQALPCLGHSLASLCMYVYH